ncbi:hypothetical protein IAD21_02588 [Abditibacteriota bacterium]|nr:hypothetical protein IAD21_02588 [Abditibacteriota bacterium]
MQNDTPLSPDELYEHALDVIRKSELSKYFDQLAPRFDFSIEIETEAAPDEDIPIGSHKIGGSPDVAPDFEWPLWNGEPLTFIAQFDLSSLVPFDPRGLLPSHGLLSFFSMLRPTLFEPEDFLMEGIIGMEPETRGAWRVLHTSSAHPLERRTSPLENEWASYPAERVSGVWNSIELPDWCEIIAPDGIWDEDEFFGSVHDAYRDIQRNLFPPISLPHDHYLLGYAHYRQDEMRGLAADFIDRDEISMRSLAQFSSRREMTFAGDGYGYFFIEKNDLKAGDFSQSYFSLQR